MKKNSLCLSWPTLTGLAVGMFSSLHPAAAADLKAGSPELPLTYDGPALLDATVPDGRLRYSPGVQNIEICRANRKQSPWYPGDPDSRLGWTYQHHVDLACWQGRLYAAWDMVHGKEDRPPFRVVYATSSDGFHWSEPQDLFPFNEAWNLRFYFYRALNGRLLAFACGPNPDNGKEKILEAKKKTLLVREITTDHRLGQIYTLVNPGPTFPPHYTQSKEAGFVAACREAYNHKPLLEQQDYGVFLGERRMKWHDAKNWPDGNMEANDYSFGKGMCFFHRKDGTLVSLGKMGFVTLSKDEGETWSLPMVPTGIVGGGGKLWAQKTPDGRYAMVYVPQIRPRWPMAVTTSDDGITFRDMRVVHGEVPLLRYGASGTKGLGPQYLRGIAEWAGDAPGLDTHSIWVIYSVNQENIWASRIPVPIVADVKDSVDDTFDQVTPGCLVPGWNTYTPAWASVRIAKDPAGANQYLELEDREPVDYARAIRGFPVARAVDVSFRLAAAQSDRGRLEIELLGDKGTRPVRIVLNAKGHMLATDGENTQDLGAYQADKWTDLVVKVKAGRFTLVRDGLEVLRNAAFAEVTPTVYALSFRTGEFRGTPPSESKQKKDLPNTEDPVPAVAYRIDDVTTKNP